MTKPSPGLHVLRHCQPFYFTTTKWRKVDTQWLCPILVQWNRPKRCCTLMTNKEKISSKGTGHTFLSLYFWRFYCFLLWFTFLSLLMILTAVVLHPPSSSHFSFSAKPGGLDGFIPPPPQLRCTFIRTKGPYGAIHLLRKSNFRAGNDVTFESTTFHLWAGKARWVSLLLPLALLAHTHTKRHTTWSWKHKNHIFTVRCYARVFNEAKSRPRGG